MTTDLALVPDAGPDRPAFAYALHEEARTLRQGIDASFMRLAAILDAVRRHELWRDLAYGSWSEYLSSPELGLSQSQLFRYMRARARWLPHLAAGTVADSDLITIGIKRADDLSREVVGASAERVRELMGAALTLPPGELDKRVQELNGRVWTEADEYVHGLRRQLHALAGRLDHYDPGIGDVLSEVTRVVEKARVDVAERFA